MFAVSFRRVSGSFKSVNDQNDVFKLLFAYIDILNSKIIIKSSGYFRIRKKFQRQ